MYVICVVMLYDIKLHGKYMYKPPMSYSTNIECTNGKYLMLYSTNIEYTNGKYLTIQ